MALAFAIYLATVALAWCVTAQQRQTALRTVTKCPSAANIAQLEHLSSMSDLASCVVACANSERCAAMHFRSSNSNCFHGNVGQVAIVLDQVSANSGSDGCVSHEKLGATNVLPPTAAPAVSLAAVPPVGLSSSLFAKLLILFDFRQSFVNLVNPARFAATPRGSVFRDSQGANFPGGNASDFIEVDTENGTLVPDYLDAENNFTFFARVVRQTYSMQSYHYFFYSSSGYVAFFGDRYGKLVAEHMYPSVPGYHFEKFEAQQSVDVVVSTSFEPQSVWAGAVFNGKNLTRLYMNGSLISTEAYSAWGRNEPPMYLRLGYYPTVADVLKGRMVCYSVAKDALTLAELRELDAFCG